MWKIINLLSNNTIRVRLRHGDIILSDLHNGAIGGGGDSKPVEIWAPPADFRSERFKKQWLKPNINIDSYFLYTTLTK